MKKFMIMVMAVCTLVFAGVTVNAKETTSQPIQQQCCQCESGGLNGNIIDVVKGQNCKCCPSCECGCKEGKPCTCGCDKCKTDKCSCPKKDCSCGCKCCPSCECGCKEGKPCTCGCDQPACSCTKCKKSKCKCKKTKK